MVYDGNISQRGATYRSIEKALSFKGTQGKRPWDMKNALSYG